MNKIFISPKIVDGRIGGITHKNGNTIRNINVNYEFTNDAINVDHISTFYKNEIVINYEIPDLIVYAISFKGLCDFRPWKFLKKEDRDDTYDRLLLECTTKIW